MTRAQLTLNPARLSLQRVIADDPTMYDADYNDDTYSLMLRRRERWLSR